MRHLFLISHIRLKLDYKLGGSEDSILKEFMAHVREAIHPHTIAL